MAEISDWTVNVAKLHDSVTAVPGISRGSKVAKSHAWKFLIFWYSIEK
jgi:hypothetical protein